MKEWYFLDYTFSNLDLHEDIKFKSPYYYYLDYCDATFVWIIKFIKNNEIYIALEVCVPYQYMQLLIENITKVL